ncbi:MAG: endonuclease/exonuclease/phosphatase family protein [Phycisphaerales bacterium]|nr:endonuclease/exonuclease/phosphatase family protein [Phycisphaerales bacterium]
MLALAASLAVTLSISDPMIRIDGTFTDWDDVPVAVDDAGDAPDGEVDLGTIRWHADGQAVYLQADIGRTLNVQRLAGMLSLVVDADGDPETGLTSDGLTGVDFIIDWSPPSRRDAERGMGTRLRVANARGFSDGTVYALDAVMAPTTAGPVFELRLRRDVALAGPVRPFAGAACRAKLIHHARNGTVTDETDIMSIALPELAPPPPPVEATTSPLARSAPDVLRVVSWNVELGALTERPQAFLGVLRALDPDVILIQELRDSEGADRLRSIVSAITPDAGAWHVVIGEGGGNLRSAIASRTALTVPASMRVVADPKRSGTDVRTAAASIMYAGRPVLLVSSHLKCCGQIGSREDETRIREASLIRDAVAALPAALRRGVVIGGDLNLVGTAIPLERLVGGIDADGTDLEIAEPFQLDGVSSATWGRRGASFIAGRLDYLAYSDATMRVAGAFVFDAADLSPACLSSSGLAATATRDASDHLPVVLDLAWVSGPPND